MDRATSRSLVLVLLVASSVSLMSVATAAEVDLTPDTDSVTVTHQGKEVEIKRNQDTGAMVNFDYALTSRRCPPFCIQPSQLAPGVETIAEMELIDYLKQTSEGDESILVIDSRTDQWIQKGMIPGAVHIPWTELHLSRADPDEVAKILQLEFGAVKNGPVWDFSEAKTLVLYCNGMWCGQSPTNIRALLSLGYPAHKLKWYRGGVQSWAILGLPRIKPEGEIVY